MHLHRFLLRQLQRFTGRLRRLRTCGTWAMSPHLGPPGWIENRVPRNPNGNIYIYYIYIYYTSYYIWLLYMATYTILVLIYSIYIYHMIIYIYIYICILIYIYIYILILIYIYIATHKFLMFDSHVGYCTILRSKMFWFQLGVSNFSLGDLSPTCQGTGDGRWPPPIHTSSSPLPQLLTPSPRFSSLASDSWDQ